MVQKDIFGNPIKGSPWGVDLGTGSSPAKSKREPVAKTQKNEVLARQKSRCADPSCRKLLDPRATHFDHIKEVYKGGKSTHSNLQALCANCHSKKTHADKLKQTEKKKAEARRQPRNPFGLDLRF